jgi:hypothetical protein
VATGGSGRHIGGVLTFLRQRLIRTWLTIAATDCIFATTLGVVAYKTTAARVWEGVASVVIGPSAINGGASAVAVGLLLHLSVALTWSVVFLAALGAFAGLRRLVSNPAGLLAVAALYGPLIWVMMSAVVIPRFTGRPPTFAFRWWVQFFGHIPFVALPIILAGSRPARSPVEDPALEPA